MSAQPEALRLAELLEQLDGRHWQVQDSAAAELRRLHELAQEQHTEIYGLRLEVRNLLEALKWIRQFIEKHGDGVVIKNANGADIAVWLDDVDAAIAKSTGKTK